MRDPYEILAYNLEGVQGAERIAITFPGTEN